MSREILFRGLAGSVWRYGDYETYTFNKKVSQICTKKKEHYTVDDTVGQYTGRKDKIGKRVFEGDLVKFTHYGDVHTAKIVFNEGTCGFEIWYTSVVGAYGEKATHKANFYDKEIEVIGNIHQNPELLTPWRGI